MLSLWEEYTLLHLFGLLHVSVVTKVKQVNYWKSLTMTLCTVLAVGMQHGSGIRKGKPCVVKN